MDYEKREKRCGRKKIIGLADLINVVLYCFGSGLVG